MGGREKADLTPGISKLLNFQKNPIISLVRRILWGLLGGFFLDFTLLTLYTSDLCDGPLMRGFRILCQGGLF